MSATPIAVTPRGAAYQRFRQAKKAMLEAWEEALPHIGCTEAETEYRGTTREMHAAMERDRARRDPDRIAKLEAIYADKKRLMDAHLADLRREENLSRQRSKGKKP